MTQPRSKSQKKEVSFDQYKAVKEEIIEISEQRFENLLKNKTEKLSKNIYDVRIELRDAESRLHNEIADVKSDLHDEISDVKTQLSGEITGVKTEISDVKTSVAVIKTEINGISKMISNQKWYIMGFMAFFGITVSVITIITK